MSTNQLEYYAELRELKKRIRATLHIVFNCEDLGKEALSLLTEAGNPRERTMPELQRLEQKRVQLENAFVLWKMEQ